MGVVPFKKTVAAPEDTTWAWDADTQNAVLGDTDDPNWTRYRDAHTWYDPDKDTVKAGFKLPHHAIIDGKLSAVWHGVTAAVARLEQSDIPESDMKGAFDHLTQHYAQWDKEPPEWDRWIADVRERRQREAARDVASLRRQTQRAPVALAGRAAALPMVATRAPISITAARPNGTPTDDDLARINALARSPLPADAVYVFPAEISNQSVDAYYTRMTPKSLQQFAQDATRGVAVCDSHNHYQLPIGRSFYGVVVPSDAGGTAAGVQATQSLAYMLRGMRTPSGMQTDDIIRGIEGGVNADVSIGFIPVAYWCSICHMDMLNNWDCMHWPGNTYEIKDPDTGVVSAVLCIADVDASLAEYSLVYDGATPNAMVLKAEAALDSGRALTSEVARQIRLVEDRCRVKLIERWNGFGTRSDAGHGTFVDAATAPTQTPVNDDGATTTEEEEMRGSEFLSRYIDTAQAEATRVGKQVSQANLDRLTAMRDKLSSGHDTMDEAMRELASFIDDVSSGAGGDTDGDGDNPAGGDPDGDGRTAGEPQVRSAAASVEIRADGNHDAFTGTHTHAHAAYGSQGDDATHEHEHSHDGDAAHEHSHATNAAPTVAGADLRTAPGTGVPNQGIEIPAADGVERVVTLAPIEPVATVATVAPELSEAQRAVFALGERMLREAHDEAIQWAVRAGAVATPDDEQRYRALFARCSYDEVATFRTHWEQMAKAGLSPRGRWTPDRGVAGGGYWTDEPTFVGGRQTQAGDPNDPQRIAATAATHRASVGVRGASAASAGLLSGAASRAGDDAALYTVAGGASGSKTRRKGGARSE